MKINVDTHGQAVVLGFKGELTVESLDGLQRTVDDQLADDDVRDLVLDLAEVPFMDSAFLEYLLGLQERLSERLGQVKLARPDGNVRTILEITRLDSAFEAFEDVAEAAKPL